MNKIKDKTMEESLKNKRSKDRAQEVFNKLIAQQKKPKNPFDELKSYTLPIKEIKPGADDVY